ncbi:basic secretory protein-like protein [Chitinophaga sp. SYP-B3965]|uniref:basic secretory protein-like protein n=1 Tax=Chitinophaga sp. SYP-B3965 TaxID=2663120 RepID=UPI001563914B|nr:basic secretory protein-like protein [Chitinophaga sp. SYP-B3965]
MKCPLALVIALILSVSAFAKSDSTILTKTVTDSGSIIYTKNGLTLTLNNKSVNFDTVVLRQRLVATFFEVYPKLLQTFNPDATKHVVFNVDSAYDGVAYASRGQITFNPGWFVKHPDDIDVVTHETMHLVQAYRGGSPGWLTEGIADYVRFKFGVENIGWALPAFKETQKYTDAYRVTARFLAWLEAHVHSGIVVELNTALRTKTYTQNTWAELTKKTLDELWADYAKSPAL